MLLSLVHSEFPRKTLSGNFFFTLKETFLDTFTSMLYSMAYLFRRRLLQNHAPDVIQLLDRIHVHNFSQSATWD